MDERIRQRVVGAVVLVALGVIFLPMLFDSPNQGWLGEDRPLIPEPAPALQQLADATRTPPAAAEPTPVEREVEAASEPAPIAAVPARAPRVPSPDPQLATWAVQVGSFSSEENAVRLRDKLRQLGFRAYTEVLEEEGKQVTRVRVGPELDEERANKLRDALKAKAKLDGIVVRHR